MGAYRSKPDKIKYTLQQANSNIQFPVCHMCGWRLYMEDASIQQLNFDGQNNHIFGVLDGHGGAEVAIFVKNHFVQELLRNQNYTLKNYKQALEQTFEKMDKLLKTEKGQKQVKKIQKQLILQDNLPKRDCKNHAGSTALICLIFENFFFISNAGDCHAYAKKNGDFKSLNHLHSPLVLEEKLRIQKAGGFVNDQGRINKSINVSRSLGDLEFKSNIKLSQRQQLVISLPQTRKQSLEGVQYILMGCDGIWEQKSPEEIEKFIDKRIKKGNKLSSILQQMFEWLICKEEEIDMKEVGKDNMTAILIKLNP